MKNALTFMLSWIILCFSERWISQNIKQHKEKKEMFSNANHIHLMSKIYKKLENVSERKSFLKDLMGLSEREEVIFCSLVDGINIDSCMKDVLVEEVNIDTNNKFQSVVNDVKNHPHTYTYSDLAKKHDISYSYAGVIMSQSKLTDLIIKKPQTEKSALTIKIIEDVKNNPNTYTYDYLAEKYNVSYAKICSTIYHNHLNHLIIKKSSVKDELLRFADTH